MKKTIISMMAAALALVSCQSLDLTSTYQVASSNVWGKATLARQAVNGIYNEFYTRSSTNSNEDDWRVMYEAYSSVMDTDKNWYENQKVCYGDGTPANGTFSEMFKYYYTFVFRANDVISHIDQVPDMDFAEKAMLKAEAKFLRAYGYMNLNVLYRGVPLYMEYIENATNANKPRSSEVEVWNAIIQDLTDCVNEENLPDRYKAGSESYGRVSRAVALAYRGQAYQWMAARSGETPAQYWQLALNDFEALADFGFSLYKGAGADSFKQLLKPANEQCDEMIFAIRCTQKSGMGNPRAVLFGKHRLFDRLCRHAYYFIITEHLPCVQCLCIALSYMNAIGVYLFRKLNIIIYHKRNAVFSAKFLYLFRLIQKLGVSQVLFSELYKRCSAVKA